MYQIEKRYQYRVKDGLEWTGWFRLAEKPDEDAAKEYIKGLPKKTNKLDNEYRITPP